MGAQNQTVITKEGSIQACVCSYPSSRSLACTDKKFYSDDTNELLALVRQLEGFPSNPGEDVYGFDTRIILSTFEVQWDNGEEVEGAEAVTNPTEENKGTFKEVMDSILALARQTAR